MKSPIRAGDTLNFLTKVIDFKASDGFTLHYRLVPRVSGAAITFDAAAEGDDYRIAVSATVTDDWGAGEYSWSSYVTKSGERYTVDFGQVTILPNPETIGTLDNRSFARKRLDELEAGIAALRGGVKSYTIGSRSMTYRDIPDMLVEYDRFKAAVADEDAAEKIAAGLGNPRNIGMRFNRP